MANHSGLQRMSHLVLCMCHIIGLLFLIISLTKDAWWINEIYFALGKSHYKDTMLGLWNVCYKTHLIGPVEGSKTCHSLLHSMSFKDTESKVGHLFTITFNQKDLDIVLLLLSLSCFGYFLSLVISIAMFKKLHADFKQWKKLLAGNMVTSLVTASIGLSSCIYSEYRFRYTWKTSQDGLYSYIRGWCVPVTWVCSLLPVILTVAMLALLALVKPK